jgi:formyltetrahydrofolate deformylase
VSAPHAILLAHCTDQPGLVRAVATFIHDHGGNIIHFDQHVDAEQNIFFMRAEWSLDHSDLTTEELTAALQQQITDPFSMRWQLWRSDDKPRLALLVSRDPHCLYDLLARHEADELAAEIALVMGNHPDLATAATRFNLPFFHVPVSADNKAGAETRQLEILTDHGVDTVVLARYMQVLSPAFVARFPSRIINIHHSFLPAFPGARPYHSAHVRGVKIIGATSHYVTDELDEGPIIHQDVVRVSHKDSVADFIRKGRDLEKIVLAKAVWWHTRRRVLTYHNKTVVFD